LFAAEGTAPKPSADSATLFARKPPSGARDAHCYWLSEDGELGEIARNLFRTLRKLDQAGYRRLFVEQVPDEGIGVAINDRLQRAAAKADAAQRDRHSP
jgi:L-threonylcarbamoyladenylate synthase